MAFGKVLDSQRRERNRRLMQRDAQHRCAVCKIALTSRRLQAVGSPKQFCSTDCVADFLAGYSEKGHA